MPAAQRFEFWRSIHTFIDVDVSGQDARKNFRADLLLHIADDGATFGRATSDDVVTRFARSDDEYVMFSVSLSGTANITTHTDARRTVNPLSSLAVIDGGRPMMTVTEGLSHVYLTVPKARIGHILTGKAGVLRDGFREIPQDGLAGLLISHLVWMARHGERLDKPSTEVAMKAAVDLAIGALAQMPDGLGPACDGRLDQAYHAAACRYIQLHLGDPDLTAEKIAHAVGCSRARRRFSPPPRPGRSSRWPWPAVLPAPPLSHAHFGIGAARHQAPFASKCARVVLRNERHPFRRPETNCIAIGRSAHPVSATRLTVRPFCLTAGCREGPP